MINRKNTFIEFTDQIKEYRTIIDRQGSEHNFTTIKHSTACIDGSLKRTQHRDHLSAAAILETQQDNHYNELGEAQ
jgi:hypothetical protein